MIMSWIFSAFLLFSIFSALLTGQGSALAAAIPQGAQAGITLCISIAGSICLWTGLGHLMERTGVTRSLARCIRPLLRLVFPSTKSDPELAGLLSANICANFMGLGNAATPLGIRAVQRMARDQPPGFASHEMCRLIVLNTASIQLIPANVAAIRSSLGCGSPFDILGAVWITSLCSASAGLLAAKFFGKLWKNV